MHSYNSSEFLTVHLNAWNNTGCGLSSCFLSLSLCGKRGGLRAAPETHWKLSEPTVLIYPGAYGVQKVQVIKQGKGAVHPLWCIEVSYHHTTRLTKQQLPGQTLELLYMQIWRQGWRECGMRKKDIRLRTLMENLRILNNVKHLNGDSFIQTPVVTRFLKGAWFLTLGCSCSD